MDLLALPESITLKIFLELPGNSLHQSRQVCHGWNSFILGNIWKSQYGMKMVEKRLEDNWSVKEPKYEETVEIIDIGNFNFSHCKTASENFLVFESKEDDEKFRTLHVFNIKTKQVQSFENIGPAAYIHAKVSDNILAVLYQKHFKSSKSTVKVWSNKTYELLFEEEFYNLHCMLLDEKSDILSLIQSDKVEVLFFDGSTFSRSRCISEYPLWNEVIIERIAFPYILFCHYEYCFHTMSMWKLDEKKKEVTQFRFFEVFEEFLDGAEEGEKEFSLTDATYVNSLFVILGTEDYTEDEGRLPGRGHSDFMATSVIKVINDEGELLRRFQLNGEFDSGNIVLINEHRLVVDFAHYNDEESVHMFDLRHLLSPGSDEIPYAKFNLKKSDLDTHHVSCYVINKTSISMFSSTVEAKSIQMKMLNFWAVEC